MMTFKAMVLLALVITMALSFPHMAPTFAAMAPVHSWR